MRKMKHSPAAISSKRLRDFRYHPLVACLVLLSSEAGADDYFDPSFLAAPGEKSPVDLSVFSQRGGMAEGRYLMTLYINQRQALTQEVAFEKNSSGKIVPVLTPELLDKLGVNVANLPAFKNLSSTAPITDLSTLIPQASTKADLAKLRLDISVPQVAMQPSHYTEVDPALWEDGIAAVIANYSVSAGRTNYDYGSVKSHSNNLFATVRSGLNAGAWRLRSTFTHTRSEYGGGHNGSTTQTQSRFSNTYLFRDFAAIRSTLMVGETSTGSEVLDGIPLKGIKLRSSEQMLPSQLRGFSPVVSGIANSNARVTVRQNGSVIYETYVAPGPFSIDDIQQAGMSGNYDVTITEADGTERQFVVPYSSLPIMLRPGGWKYEVASGRYNGGVTTDSRKSDFFLGTFTYGMPKNATVYTGVIASKDYQAFTFGTGISLGAFGALSTDVTSSFAHFEKGGQKNGASFRVRYSKSLTDLGTSIDLTALRYSTQDYYNFTEFNSQGYQLKDGVSPWSLSRRRASFQTQINQQLGEWGSVHLRANREDYWGNDRTLTGLGFGYSGSHKGIGYGVNYTIDRIKDKRGNWPENRQIAFNVNVPFSIFGRDTGLENIYATAQTTHDNTGRTQNQLGLSGSAYQGAVSYSLSQSWGNQGQEANSNANVGYQGSKGNVSAGYSYSNHIQSMNVSASGGVLAHSEGVTLSRSMGESVALVKAPKADGVTVNGGSAVTNHWGYAVAPYLSDYRKNSIHLDPSTLPTDVELLQTSVNVYPTRGAVVKADFTTRVGYQVLMTLTQNQTKEAVPFGAIATVSGMGESNSSIVGDAGQVYLTGLPEKGSLMVNWGKAADQQCHVNFDLTGLTATPEMPIRQVMSVCSVK